MSDDINRCAICLEEITKGNHLEILPCDHIFHYECIKHLQKKQCPLCRLDIPLLDNIIIQLPSMEDDTNVVSRGEICKRIFIVIYIASIISSILVLFRKKIFN